MPIKQTSQKRKFEQDVVEIEEGRPRKILKSKNTTIKKTQNENEEIHISKKNIEKCRLKSKDIEALLNDFDHLNLYIEEITSSSTKEEEEGEVNLERRKEQISQIKREEAFIDFEKIENSNDSDGIMYFQDNDEEKLFQIHVIGEVQEFNFEKNDRRFDYKDEEDTDDSTHFSNIIQQKTFKGISKPKKRKNVKEIV